MHSMLGWQRLQACMLHGVLQSSKGPRCAWACSCCRLQFGGRRLTCSAACLSVPTVLGRAPCGASCTRLSWNGVQSLSSTCATTTPSGMHSSCPSKFYACHSGYALNIVLKSCCLHTSLCRQQVGSQKACMQSIPGTLEQVCAGRQLPKVVCGNCHTEAAAAAVAADGAQEPAGLQGPGVLLVVPCEAGAARREGGSEALCSWKENRIPSVPEVVWKQPGGACMLGVCHNTSPPPWPGSVCVRGYKYQRVCYCIACC